MLLKSFALATLALLAAGAAQANTGDTFGFGSRGAALGGATVAGGYDGFAAWHNPAGMSRDTESRLDFSYGIVWMKPEFTPIQGVVIENDYTSDQLVRGDVDTSYRTTFGQEIGFAYRAFPEAKNLSFGATVYTPFENLTYVDTGSTYAPEYVLYRSRTQRPQVELAVALEPVRSLSIGAGVHLGYTVTSKAENFLQTAGSPSTLRLTSSVKPKAAPYLGALFDNGGPFILGAVVRFPLASDNFLDTNASAQLVSSLAALDIAYHAQSVLSYDPLTASIGMGLRTETATVTHFGLYSQVDWQRWSAFESPAIQISGPTINNCNGNLANCGITIGSAANPMFQTHDIFVPRIGGEFGSGMLTLRAGYAYKPSIFKGGPTGAGNFLDPPRHQFSAGMGFKFPRFLRFEVPCSLDFHASYQPLVTQRITKDPGDETGAGSGDLKIGAPGYDAGGKLYGGGASLTLAL